MDGTMPPSKALSVPSWGSIHRDASKTRAAYKAALSDRLLRALWVSFLRTGFLLFCTFDASCKRTCLRKEFMFITMSKLLSNKILHHEYGNCLGLRGHIKNR
jgi:hypothetical protein